MLLLMRPGRGVFERADGTLVHSNTLEAAFARGADSAILSREVASEILAHCRKRLAPYKRIRRIEFAPLPKTISGKIRRIELRQMEADRRAGGERAAHEYFEEDL